jgi:hypothetical protein
MTGFGRTDATGRSSGKLTAADHKMAGPPDGEAWAWEPAALLNSKSRSGKLLSRGNRM